MTASRGRARSAVVVVDTDVITVRGYEVRDTLRRARMRPIHVVTTGGWMLDRKRLGDAVAALERAGHAVRFEGQPLSPEPATPMPTLLEGPVVADEDGLW